MSEYFRRAIRSFRRDPGLTLTATLTLALCIAANTTVFSIVNTILIRPLPFPDSDRLYWLTERLGRDQHEVGLGPDYYSLREQSRAFQEIGAFDTNSVNWTGIERPEQLDAAYVTPSFFQTLGTAPVLGRYLAAGEEGPQAPPVVVLSYSFWRSRLGSDRNVLGRKLLLAETPATVIGVMPQGFDYPRGTQIWRPMSMNRASQLPRSGMRPLRIVNMLARLRPGISDQQLQTELTQLTRAIRAEYPREFETAGFLDGMAVLATPLQRRIAGDLRSALLVLTGAVALVLLIACANLTNLLLARAASRSKEAAVRMALGAGRGRIVRQMLTESLALAIPGGVAGMALANLCVRSLNFWKPLVLERYPAISLDLTTLVFTFGLILVTALLVGFAPALGAANTSIQESLKAASLSQTGTRAAARSRQFLIVAELAVSLVLLIGAGLLARSFVNLARAELGFSRRIC
jgi:predicted permease